jgi:hypothetical protein
LIYSPFCYYILVIVLLEVKGKDVFSSLVKLMPAYQFHITEGSQAQQVLVGVKNEFTAFFARRTEFKSGNSLQRFMELWPT